MRNGKTGSSLADRVRPLRPAWDGTQVVGTRPGRRTGGPPWRELHASLTGRLQQLGIPANFQSIVINAVETGTVPSSGNAQGAGGAAGAGEGKLVQQVIQAAYSAFYSGLRAALFLSAALILAAGLFTVAIEVRKSHHSAGHQPGQ